MEKMQNDNQYYVYIMTNKSGTLYIGMTNDIKKRVFEHKNNLIEGFTPKYNMTRLVYFEAFSDLCSAITREKSLDGWLRNKIVELIKTTNPDWEDLSRDWYE